VDLLAGGAHYVLHGVALELVVHEQLPQRAIGTTDIPDQLQLHGQFSSRPSAASIIEHARATHSAPCTRTDGPPDYSPGFGGKVAVIVHRLSGCCTDSTSAPSSLKSASVPALSLSGTSRNILTFPVALFGFTATCTSCQIGSFEHDDDKTTGRLIIAVPGSYCDCVYDTYPFRIEERMRSALNRTYGLSQMAYGPGLGDGNGEFIDLANPVLARSLRGLNNLSRERIELLLRQRLIPEPARAAAVR
jgi:hypothetical protein